MKKFTKSIKALVFGTAVMFSLIGLSEQANAQMISTIAGNGTGGNTGNGFIATSAELGRPYGVTLDAAGNIYIAEFDNDDVRKVTVSSGYITIISSGGLSGVTGVAVNGSGNIYIADYWWNVIRQGTTGNISIYAGDLTGA